MVEGMAEKNTNSVRKNYKYLAVILFIGVLIGLSFIKLGRVYTNYYLEDAVVQAETSINPQSIIEAPSNIVYSNSEHSDQTALAKEAEEMVKFIMHRNYKIYQEMAEEIAQATIAASEEFNVPVTILIAIMDIESDYRYDAVSKAGAIGLTQVHAPTWFDKKNKGNLAQAGIAKSKRDLFSPDINIRAGAYILQLYMHEGIRKKVSNPVQYAATRYLGGTKNTYYAKLITALGEYQIFNYRMGVEEATKKSLSGNNTVASSIESGEDNG